MADVVKQGGYINTCDQPPDEEEANLESAYMPSTSMEEQQGNSNNEVEDIHKDTARLMAFSSNRADGGANDASLPDDEDYGIYDGYDNDAYVLTEEHLTSCSLKHKRRICLRLCNGLGYHTSILTFPETRVTTLPNGLRVATEANLASPTATVGVWIDAGEQTAFYVKCLGGDVAKGVEVLSDILQNSSFDEALIERERGVILREMQEVNEQNMEVILDHLHATAFQYTPLGRTILGPAENIAKITKKDIQDYISTHYAAHRMVICASGAVKHEDLVEQVKKMFTKLSANPLTTSQIVEKEPAMFTGSEIRMRDDDAPLAKFAVAFNGTSWTDPDSIALMVIQSMLGSWDKSFGGGKHMGSQLAQMVAISELAESITSFNTNYKDTGLFGVYATAKADCLDDLAFAIMQEVTKLCYRVGDDDVTRARNQLKSSLLLHVDGTSATAEDIGRQLLTYGRRIPKAELFARIDAVDAAAIKRVANRFIFDQDLAIVASGPVKLLPDYNWFRRRTYKLRY
nr:probable mitochondrial-processing peptidase subunit beta, mitochondrial [Tanacetum cinerariifolium]